MKESRKSITPNSNLSFIGEVGKICPLCGESLIFSINKRKITNFEIAHIYPLNASQEEALLLKDCERLSTNLDDDNNKIALCIKCHRIYDKTKTVTTYNKLVEIKKQIIKKFNITSLLNNINVEEAVLEIVVNLTTIEKSEKATLTIDPIKVENKISDKLLCTKIKGYVAEYYDYVNDCFIAQNISDTEYDNILMTFKIAYNKTYEIYKNDQQAIFDSLVKWLKTKSNINNDVACEIVVSYFVQHCEVFNDLSK